MTVSRRLRFEILRRDGYACRYCGATAPDATLTVDHVIPTTLGGGDEAANLVTACTGCNAGKSSIAPDSPIVEDVDAAALLWAKAIEKAAEIRRGAADEAFTRLAYFDEEWITRSGGAWRPDDWHLSVERWLALGLDLDDMDRFMFSTFSRPRDAYWRYFCGCCWGELRERQELARRLLEDGDA